MTRPGIEVQSNGPLVNTVTTRPMDWYLCGPHQVSLENIYIVLFRFYIKSGLKPYKKKVQ